jgi:hypothetical protein
VQVLQTSRKEAFRVADFNGDGYADIAIVWPQNSGVFVYYSRGDGTFYLGAILDTVDLVGGLPGAGPNIDLVV